jgi:predicted nucleic acid-binding protein
MIILDTNVVSELMRLVSDKGVVAWLDLQAATSIWITSVTVFEVRTGIEVLPPGRRRTDLSADFEQYLEADIQGRVIPFDTRAALLAARLTADRQRAGRSGDLRDTMIAGNAIVAEATLATRNVRHFADLPIAVINPWSA